MITEEMYEMEIPIIIDKDLVTYEYDSCERLSCIYGHIESCDRRDIKIQAWANKWGRQTRSCNNVLRLTGEGISRWTHSSQYFEIFIHVPHNPVHCNRSRSVRQKSKPWKGLLTRNSSEISVLWPRKTHPMVGQKIRSSKKELECKISKYLK